VGEKFVITNLQAANVIAGGTGNTIEGGPSTVNVYAPAGDLLSQLRAALDDLAAAAAGAGVPPAVRSGAQQAQKEAARAQPRASRLRALVKAVKDGAGNATAVTQAAVNVLAIVDAIAKMVR
jgi:hypothetical protein